MIHNYIAYQVVFYPLTFQLSHVSIVRIPKPIGFIQRADNIPNLRIHKQAQPLHKGKYHISKHSPTFKGFAWMI